MRDMEFSDKLKDLIQSYDAQVLSVAIDLENTGAFDIVVLYEGKMCRLFGDIYLANDSKILVNTYSLDGMLSPGDTTFLQMVDDVSSFITELV